MRMEPPPLDAPPHVARPKESNITEPYAVSGVMPVWVLSKETSFLSILRSIFRQNSAALCSVMWSVVILGTSTSVSHAYTRGCGRIPIQRRLLLRISCNSYLSTLSYPLAPHPRLEVL